MAEQTEKIFAGGLFVSEANDKAKEFGVKYNFMIRVQEFTKFIETHEVNDKVYITLRESKAGKDYIELDQYRRKQEQIKGIDEAPKPKVKAEELPEVDLDEITKEVDDINVDHIDF